MIVDWSRAFVLSDDELVVCWQILELGELPLALALRPLGASEPERRRLHAEVTTELGRRGLAGPGGPCAPLAQLLGLLACPVYQLDIRMAGTGKGMLVGLGSVSGAHGVLVAAAGGVLRLTGLDAARVPGAVVELAGPVRAGAGSPVNIPADLLDDACRAGGDGNLWTLADQLVVRGVARVDASSMARMCAGIERGGQLGATGYLDGVERRAPWVIGFHHTPNGDFLQMRRPTPGGAPVVTIAPVTAERLLYQLRELVDRLPVAQAG